MTYFLKINFKKFKKLIYKILNHLNKFKNSFNKTFKLTKLYLRTLENINDNIKMKIPIQT